MELDKRIKAITDIQSVTSILNNRDLDKKGYFADHIAEFKDLSKCMYGEFVEYREHEQCFLCEIDHYDGTFDHTYYRYFIPEDSLLPVEKPEKKYRPYSLEEFLEIFGIGDQIVFRVKNDDDIKCAMFTGYITDVERIDDKTPGACEVMLGIFHYSLLDLFKDFERFYNGRWWSFGTEVKENEE